MNLLIITRNIDIFNENNSAYKELLACSEKIEQLHVVVLNKKAKNEKKDKSPQRQKTEIKNEDSEEKQTINISNKLFIYPTNSAHSLFYIFDTLRIVKLQTIIKFKFIIDLISAEDTGLTGFIAYLIAKKYKRNFIVNIYTNIFSPDEDEGLIKRLWCRDITNFILGKARGIRTASQLIGEVIYSKFPNVRDKIFVLPYLAETERFQHLNASIDIHKKYNQFNIIFVHIAKHIRFKTILRLRNIMRLVKHRYPLAGLIIVGRVKKRFWHPWFYSHMLPSMKFENYSDNVQGYLKTANVFLDTASNNDQGGPLTEAALIGCPIIASKTKASIESVEDGKNGFIEDPRKPEAFFKKIIDILETPGLREAMHFAKFNISEALYGKTDEEYYTRLVDIWDLCKTDEEIVKVPTKEAITPLFDDEQGLVGEGHKYLDKFGKLGLRHGKEKPFPIITMNLIKKVQEKLEEKRAVIDNQKRVLGDDIVDLDSVRSTIDEALQELENVGIK